MWEGLTRMNSLDIGKNFIQFLPTHAFANAPELRFFNLYFNAIHEITPDIWEPGNKIEFLNLRNNQISHLSPGVFKNLQVLEILHFENNQLQGDMFGAFEGLGRLKDLFLNNNQLTELSAQTWMGFKTQASELYLSGNPLVLTPNMFQGLGELGALFLNSANISTLSKEFWVGLDNLWKLELISNTIRELEPLVFSGLKRLAFLHMQNNRLTTINHNVFDPKDFPKTGGHPENLWFYLEGNPIQCDGNLDWMIGEDWLESIPLGYAKCANYPDKTLEAYVQCFTCN